MASRAARGATAAVLAILAGPVRVVLAHDGAPPEPHDLWQAWSWPAAVPLALAALAYARGLRLLWHRAGPGRGVRRWRAGAYAAGLLALAVALVSPLDALGSALFSAHMVQHLLLIVVVAPLLVLGRPIVPLLWALPAPVPRLLGGWWQRAAAARAGWALLTRLPLAWALHAAALWIWHLPSLYQAALADGRVHLAEHAAFLGTALLFWWTVVHPDRQGVVAYGTSAVAVFFMAMQGGLLGALMTFAPSPWYPAYAASAVAWGLTPLDDQQLAGMIMWAPAGLIYLAATLALLAAWLRAAERRACGGEHGPGPATISRRRSRP
jgi:putative membrane protein